MRSNRTGITSIRKRLLLKYQGAAFLHAGKRFSITVNYSPDAGCALRHRFATSRFRGGLSARLRVSRDNRVVSCCRWSVALHFRLLLPCKVFQRQAWWRRGKVLSSRARRAGRWWRSFLAERYQQYRRVLHQRVEAFGVGSDDALWLAPEERVNIW